MTVRQCRPIKIFTVVHFTFVISPFFMFFMFNLRFEADKLPSHQNPFKELKNFEAKEVHTFLLSYERKVLRILRIFITPYFMIRVSSV